MKVLFLDDMMSRHSEFNRQTDRIGSATGDPIEVVKAYTAKRAIDLLNKERFDQVFLDHDLSEDDIMVAVGGDSKVPTGMDVVDHILTMDNPPMDIVVHSCNGPASWEMVVRLERHPAKPKVMKLAFPHLIEAMRRKP